jgi:hypothetical protein
MCRAIFLPSAFSNQTTQTELLIAASFPPFTANSSLNSTRSASRRWRPALTPPSLMTWFPAARSPAPSTPRPDYLNGRVLAPENAAKRCAHRVRRETISGRSWRSECPSSSIGPPTSFAGTQQQLPIHCPSGTPPRTRRRFAAATTRPRPPPWSAGRPPRPAPSSRSWITRAKSSTRWPAASRCDALRSTRATWPSADPCWLSLLAFLFFHF